MGLYPNRKTIPYNTMYLTEWIEEIDYYGYKKQRKVTATEWVETERTDCYCCSCDNNEWGGRVNDPYCRNHGWYGERPCEVHNMPGEVGEDGNMPDSVQAIIARRKEKDEQIAAGYRLADNPDDHTGLQTGP